MRLKGNGEVTPPPQLCSPGVNVPVHGIDFCQVTLERLPELQLDAAHRGHAPCRWRHGGVIHALTSRLVVTRGIAGSGGEEEEQDRAFKSLKLYHTKLYHIFNASQLGSIEIYLFFFCFFYTTVKFCLKQVTFLWCLLPIPYSLVICTKLTSICARRPSHSFFSASISAFSAAMAVVGRGCYLVETKVSL